LFFNKNNYVFFSKDFIICFLVTKTTALLKHRKAMMILIDDTTRTIY
jgi:hypothetical protein